YCAIPSSYFVNNQFSAIGRIVKSPVFDSAATFACIDSTVFGGGCTDLRSSLTTMRGKRLGGGNAEPRKESDVDGAAVGARRDAQAATHPWVRGAAGAAVLAGRHLDQRQTGFDLSRAQTADSGRQAAGPWHGGQQPRARPDDIRTYRSRRGRIPHPHGRGPREH